MLLLKPCFNSICLKNTQITQKNRLNILTGEPPSPRASPHGFLLQVSQTPSRSFQAFNLKCENRPRSVRAVRGPTPVYPACQGWSPVFSVFKRARPFPTQGTVSPDVPRGGEPVSQVVVPRLEWVRPHSEPQQLFLPTAGTRRLHASLGRWLWRAGQLPTSQPR